MFLSIIITCNDIRVLLAGETNHEFKSGGSFVYCFVCGEMRSLPENATGLVYQSKEIPVCNQGVQNHNFVAQQTFAFCERCGYQRFNSTTLQRLVQAQVSPTFAAYTFVCSSHPDIIFHDLTRFSWCLARRLVR
jgi:hypothetical protein